MTHRVWLTMFARWYPQLRVAMAQMASSPLPQKNQWSTHGRGKPMVSSIDFSNPIHWFFPTSLCGVLVFRLDPTGGSRLRRFPSLTTPHSSTSHTSLYTSHLSHLPHHSPLFTGPLITSHSSFTTLHHTTPHSSASHASLIILTCGALGPPLPLAWQAQYTEPRGGAAARVAAAGPRLPLAWQAQYTEPPGGAAARVAAAGPRLPFASGSCFSLGSRRSCSRLRRRRLIITTHHSST